MARLIDADALLRDIERYHVSDGKFQHWVEIQPTVHSWISVKDRLPDKSEEYIVCAIDEDGERFVTTDSWLSLLFGGWYLFGEKSTSKVTHWMPLPEPPKEEEE